MNVERSLNIPGYMSEKELEYLASIASKCNVIVEVGSLHGRSTVALAENTDGIIFAVDTFSGDLETNENFDPFIFRKFMENTKEFGNILPIPVSSMRAAKIFLLAGIKADAVFLDGDHNADALGKDIIAWSNILRSGGYLLGHDYGFPNWPDVKTIVDQLIPKFRTIETIWTTEGC